MKRTEAAAKAKDAAPETIGPYKIIGVLGEGGMSTVYLADQCQPFRRRVALKIIKLGMDTKQVIARFEAEHQTLALMHHPNIAKVFDAGRTDDGRPYIVMEQVSGVPITTYCDERKLDVGGRLELFTDVCRAVHHAHQKGIIHRDIKPSNVLVHDQDGEPVPKIIDFGIAKATSEGSTERTLFTEAGWMIGTPEYMSPEQAGMSGAHVDTRTDVYSLGVLLYELLVGRLPFDPAELRRAGFLGIQRAIREEDPPKPSMRLMTVDDSRNATKDRRADAVTLLRQLRGDLDWITMKTLEKDPTLRYQSASELAADIERHLKHEPVEAGAPSAWYRMRKFVRRYKVQAAAALAVFASLVGGTIVSGTQYVRAEKNARFAKDNETRAREKADAAERERKRAEDKAREAAANLAKVDLVSLVVKLEKASVAEEELYPAWPQQMAAMQKWLRQQGEPLAGALPKVESALAELRRKALEYTPEERRRARERHPDAGSLRQMRAAHEAFRQNLGTIASQESTAWNMVQARLDRLNERIPALEAKIATACRYEFANGTDRFLHDTLAKLVQDLETFLDPIDGATARVKERLAWAGSIGARTLEDCRGRWEEAVAAITAGDGLRASELYRGFELKPQVGLVPIGMDPESKLWEFAHLRSGTIPARDPKTGRLRIDGETGLVFVLIPAGTFHMGAQKEDPTGPNYDPHAQSDESPVKPVKLSAFLVSKFEMTQGQWKRLSREKEPSTFKAGQKLLSGELFTWANPVENLNWVMCDRLLRRHGLVLPTEAQWEYACRAGTTTPWSTGLEATSLQNHANLADRYAKKYAPWKTEAWLDDGHVFHAAAGSFRPNAFGLHDMQGNVAEWCRDRLGDYDSNVAPGDGQRQVSGSGPRVMRSGHSISTAIHVRSACRGGGQPNTRGGGVRPARPVTD